MKEYTVSEYKLLLEKLHSFHPAGFDGFEAWRFLHIYGYRYMLSPQQELKPNGIKKLLVSVKSVIRTAGFLMMRRCELAGADEVGDKTVLYLSDYYDGRQDMRDTVGRIAELSDELGMVRPAKSRRFKPSPKYFFYALNWSRRLNRLGTDPALVLQMLHYTAEAYIYYEAIKKSGDSLLRSNALISLNDENADENILVQFCARHGIPTVTLQHGHFWNTKDSEQVIHYAHNFRELTADRLWAWGQYTCDMAVKDGVARERLVPVGIPKYVDEPEKLPLAHNRVFGVFFDTAYLGGETNFDLIRFADHLSAVFGYSYYVKLHPTDSPDRYRDCFKGRFLGFAEPMSVLEFSERIDFSLVCASTVVFEQLYFRKPSFRYLRPGSIDLFEGMDFSVFSDEEQLDKLMRLYTDSEDEYMKRYEELTEYCCGAGSIAENYKNSIRELNGERHNRV